MKIKFSMGDSAQAMLKALLFYKAKGCFLERLYWQTTCSFSYAHSKNTQTFQHLLKYSYICGR